MDEFINYQSMKIGELRNEILELTGKFVGDNLEEKIKTAFLKFRKELFTYRKLGAARVLDCSRMFNEPIIAFDFDHISADMSRLALAEYHMKTLENLAKKYVFKPEEDSHIELVFGKDFYREIEFHEIPIRLNHCLGIFDKECSEFDKACLIYNPSIDFILQVVKGHNLKTMEFI